MADPNVYDPSLVAALLQASTAPESQALAKQRMAYGHEDYQTPSPQGYRVGGTYMAASPLEHIASAFKQGLGAYQQGKSMQNMQDLIAQQGQARSAYAKALERMFGNMAGPGTQAYDAAGIGTGGEF